MVFPAYISGLFHIDTLSKILISLVSFIGIIVYLFSRKYMNGDARYYNFSRNLFMLLSLVMIMAIADNLLLFLIAWASSNWILVKLIIHKPEWKAASASGRIAGQNFIRGLFCLAVAFALLYLITGETSIHSIVYTMHSSPSMVCVLILLLLAAMTQSAIWPFHRWLISSLNSPTPVSAIMHAGIINGGGFLLARFAPLYFNFPALLTVIFILGMITAFLGSLWKLMQHDVKRMLACSTMGQMGFMFAQCGLGLFPAAVGHLCWHGMFKAYLFLASGSAAHENRHNLGYPPRIPYFLAALVGGLFASYGFSLITHTSLLVLDTTLLIVVIVFIFGSQLALTIVSNSSLRMLPVVSLISLVMGVMYGALVHFFDYILSPLHLMRPQALTIFHWIALIILLVSWFCVLFVRSINQLPNWVLPLYVKILNSSQPYSATITAFRNSYKYR